MSSSEARIFHHAADISDDVWTFLRENEAMANIILPFAEKARGFARGDDRGLWVASYDDADRVDFVLSCTTGELGKYPIFVVPSKAAAQRAQEGKHGEALASSLRRLVYCLLEEVPAQRVFSIFSIAPVTESFAKVFVEAAHARGQDAIEARKDPYYDATFFFCDRKTLKEPSASSHKKLGDVAISLLHAGHPRLDQYFNGIKALCQEFSRTSPPFELDDARAELEARTLIANKQVWVHLVKRGDEEEEVACLVATTRESDNVTAVTKVFTAERWRGHGCADRLLHRVYQEVLKVKKLVVLYAGNSDELAPARKLYQKIGFQGFDGQQVEGVARWLEFGFKGTDLGYW